MRDNGRKGRGRDIDRGQREARVVYTVDRAAALAMSPCRPCPASEELGCVARAAAPAHSCSELADVSPSAVPHPDGETEGLAFSFVLAPRQDPSWTLVFTI